MIEKIINMLISAWLFVMCADLLYLYYARVWGEPIRWLERTEIIMLFAIGLFSLGYFVILFDRFLSEH